jgi:predicted MPP superfamily phosphohydrolase
MIFAILLAFFVTLIGHYYLYMRLIYTLFGNNNFWVTIFFVLWAITFFGFLILRIIPQFLRKMFETIMFFWMGSAFIFIIVCLMTSPLNLLFKQIQFGEIYLCYFVFIVGSFLSIYSVYLALKTPKVIETKIKITKALPQELNTLKIVVLSDIHVSGLIGKRRMQKIQQIVNSLHADIILITGDLMDGSLKQLKKEIEPLRQLKSKSHVFYITGNHEYYSGSQNWKQHFSKNFFWKVLSNDSHSVKINNLCINILGIEDRTWLNYKKIPRKLDQRIHSAVTHLKNSGTETQKALNILLAHQPKDAKNLHQFPLIDLQVSGHTHGGQIWPLEYIVKKDQKFVKGLYQINEHQQLYVNQGTGFWGPPMRLGTTCEISLLTFQGMLG